jgi:hypothetical protein
MLLLVLIILLSMFIVFIFFSSTTIFFIVILLVFIVLLVVGLHCVVFSFCAYYSPSFTLSFKLEFCWKQKICGCKVLRKTFAFQMCLFFLELV